MIENIIHEREYARKYAENDIISMWGGDQAIGGPIIAVPYIEHVKNYDANTKVTTYKKIKRYAYFLPDMLVIDGHVEPETRYRGIYEVTLYKTDLQVSGEFGFPDFSEWDISKNDIIWDEAFFFVELPELFALRDKVVLNWDSKNFQFKSDQGKLGMFNGAIMTGLSMFNSSNSSNNSIIGSNKKYSFSFNLKLNGSHFLRFLPLGKETKVTLKSDWPSPKFKGSIIPTTRDVGEDGFNAYWHVHSISRSYPQRFKHEEIDTQNIISSCFGVELIIPLDTYLKSTRSLKYGILFLLLPFLTFFLFEVFSKKKIHLFQYLLVGLASCIFYLLLISISEHIFFDIAYILSSAAISGLIIFYSKAVLGSWKKSFIIALILFGLYIFLYSVLQSEDYALLIGSVGLFIILGIVMIITRKIDWYELGNNKLNQKAKDNSSTL